MQVGQKVYLKPVNNRARYIKNDILNHIVEAEVEKVGNKYFYLKGYERYKFSIEEMHDISDCCNDFEVYMSKQEIADEIEAEALAFNIRSRFNSYGKTVFSLNQLKKIKAIIDEK